MEAFGNRVLSVMSPKRIVIIILSMVAGVVLVSTVYSSSPSSSSATSSTGRIGLSQNIGSPSKSLLSTSFGSHKLSAQQAGRNDNKYLSKQTKQRFPQAIIIGVKKGGTRALIDMLKSHPQVASPKGEVHFFDKEEAFRKGEKWYIQQMPYSTADQVTIEKSPSYFVTPKVPQRIHTLSPNIKLILIVRDPIDRAISDFSQLHSPGRNSKNMTFENLVIADNQVDSSVSVIRVSTYDTHMARWLTLFPLQQIHIVNGDALIQNPASEIIKVQAFLGIKSFFQEDMFYYNVTKGFYCWRKTADNGHVHPNCLGSGKGRPHPNISNEAQQLLKNYFTPHNENFFKLVKRKFDWNDS